MPNEPKRNTAYRQYVEQAVHNFLESGAGAYSYAELAAMVGLKPTQHFRRHLKHMAACGTIELIHAFTPRGGLELRFTRHVPESEQEFPF